MKLISNKWIQLHKSTWYMPSLSYIRCLIPIIKLWCCTLLSWLHPVTGKQMFCSSDWQRLYSSICSEAAFVLQTRECIGHTPFGIVECADCGLDEWKGGTLLRLKCYSEVSLEYFFYPCHNFVPVRFAEIQTSLVFINVRNLSRSLAVK